MIGALFLRSRYHNSMESLSRLFRDFRYAFRSLRRSPAMATAAIVPCADIFVQIVGEAGFAALPARGAAKLDPIEALRFE